MKKILHIAWKDFLITYRDFTVLLIIIAAPLAMTMVMNFAFSGSDTGFSVIPVALINNDDGMVGTIFYNAFESDEVKAYLSVTSYYNLDQALADLEKDKVAVVISIPAGLSDLLVNPNKDTVAEYESLDAAIDLFPNPTRPVSVQIVEAILDTIMTDLNSGFAAGSLGFSQLLQQGLITQEELFDGMGESIGEKLQPLFDENAGQVKIEAKYQNNESNGDFDWLSYMAPSMAILYLSFSMNSSARSILSEHEKGTLPRLLISPNLPRTILTGKMLGTFLIGFTQIFIFIVISHFVLGVQWGGIPQLFVFTIAIVLAVASWGILVASLARNSGQASAIGTAVTLVFAALSGNFIPRGNFPSWLKTIGYIAPNAWGIEGYLKMIQGASFTEMLPSILALSSMAILLLTIASIAFRRQYQTQ